MSKITNLEVGEVGLLVELCLLETEGVHDVVDGLLAVLEALVLLLGGGVGTLIRSVRFD